MQDRNGSRTTTPPVALIRWWFTKTKEEQQALLQNPTTSDKVRENIHAVECFAQNHSYFVACATNLEACPLPPLTSVAGCTLLGWEYGVWLPLPMHDETTYGGRYAPTQTREIRRQVTHRLLNEVRTRTAMVLRDYNTCLQTTLSLRHVSHNQASSIAVIIVETLIEACMAAVYRLGLPEALEKIENEKAQAETTASQRYRYTGGEAAPQPIGARRATAQSSLGVWMLLCLNQTRTGTVDSEGELIPQAVTSGPVRVGKRPRNDDADGTTQAPRDAERNAWRMLREQLAPSTEDPLYRKSDNGDHSDGHDELLTTLVPHTSPRINITALDMRFGIAKALSSLRRRTA